MQKYLETSREGEAEFYRFYQRTKTRLEQKIEAFNKEIVSEPEIHVQQGMEEFARMNGGGKMIRGVLAGLGYALFSDGPEAYSDGLSLAFEIFQTAILIHDDIIDHAQLRRNQPTIPTSYMTRWPEVREARSTANSMALCVGDMGLYWANQQLLTEYAEAPCFGRLFRCYNDTILNTIRGEMIDVALPFEERHSLADNLDLYGSILEIYRLKTAWYTVTGPLKAGAILGGCPEAELQQLEAFAENLGIAFQIRDDILGIYAEEAELGKDIGSDVAEFKQTLLYEYTRRDSTAYQELMKYYGRKPTPEDLNRIRELFHTSGALGCAEEKLNTYYAAAARALDAIDFLTEEKKLLLTGLMCFLRDRKK